ncbi:MAG: DHA2 family efflux MFS transporter permease subunit [Steroidobacteraceae bacterium]
MAASGIDARWTPARSVAGRHNPWSIVGVISIATLMSVLDATIANVALDHIAASFSATYDESTWVLTSYLVANAVIIPASGWLADVVGRKRYYMLSVAIFSASSLLCGLAPSLSMLVVARVLQGVGGGGLAPVEQSMLADTFPPSKRGAAFAAYGGVVIIGPIVGPTLGGWITDVLSWHWAFFINVPTGMLSLALVSIFVDEPEAVRRHTARLKSSGVRFDYIGFAFASLWLGCMEVALDRGQIDDWFSSPLITVFSVVALLSFLALIPWELMHDRPLINLHLLRSGNFAVSCVLLTALGITMFGTMQVIPQLLQEVLGYTATQAGLVLTAAGVFTMIAMGLVGALSNRVDVRLLVAVGFALQAISLYLMGHLNTQMSFYDAVAVRVPQAFGAPFLFIPINLVAYAELAPEENNQASAFMNVLRNLGGTVGIATMQTMLTRGAQLHQSQLVQQLNPLNPNYNAFMRHLTHSLGGQGPRASGAALGMLYGIVQKQAQMLAYIHVFYFFAGLALCMLPLLLLMRRPGHEGRAQTEAAVSEGAL